MAKVPFGETEIRIIQEVIEEINLNNRRPLVTEGSSQRKTTTYELALRLFLRKGSKGVKFSRIREILSLHSKADDLDTATSKLIGRLKQRVELKGGTIVCKRIKNATRRYWIVGQTD